MCRPWTLREQYLDDPAESGDVVLVSHGAAIRLVAAQLAGVPGLFAANNHLANTQSVELTPLAGGGWECVRWGNRRATVRAPGDPPARTTRWGDVVARTVGVARRWRKPSSRSDGGGLVRW